MNVIFTCGGTAGHVNPALALAGYMKKQLGDVNVLFVGTPGGMERRLVEKSGYPFRGVEVSSFRRSLSPEGIAHNLKTLRTLVTSPGQARKILKEFQPDLVVGTGGYASYPMVKYAAKAGIPTAVHESNMVPGLTTKMLEGYADRIMVGFEECRNHYKHPDKIVVTGTPVRGDFFDLTKDQASSGGKRSPASPSTTSTRWERPAGRPCSGNWQSGNWTSAPPWTCGNISTIWRSSCARRIW